MPRFLATTSATIFAMLVAVGVTRADTLLVARKSADALEFVDPGSGARLASVAVGHRPHEVSVSPDGRRAVVSNYGIGDRPGHTISIVDLQQPREVRRIDLMPHTRPHGVAWFMADRLAVTTEGSAHLLVVDPDSGRIVSALATGQETSHMVSVAPSGEHAFVANIGSGSLTALALGTSAAAAVRQVDTGAGSEGVAVAPDGGEVWVAARELGRITVLDARSLEPRTQFAMPGIPIRIAFAPDGARAYVTCAGSGEVVVFDAATRRESGRRKLELPLAPSAAQRTFATLARGSTLPVGVAVARDAKTLFVAATMADKVVQLDARTLAVLRVIDVDGEPDGLAVTAVLPRAACHACAAEGSPEASQHDDQ